MNYRTPIIIALSFVVPLFALAADTSDLGFVSLTNIPALQGAGNQATLPDFLNNLYKLAIGIAAVLAVLQIVRAGIMYMGGDSVTEKKEAKSLIALSIGGLILVLSPVIVFSIINPKILDLKIGGLDALGRTGQFTDASQQALWTDSTASRDSARTRCSSVGGTATFTCTPAGGVPRGVLATEACTAGETNTTICQAPAGSPASRESCTDQYTNITAINPDKICSAAANYSTIPLGCCSGIVAGGKCCGQLKTTGETHGASNAERTAELQYGWRIWYTIPDGPGKTKSELKQSSGRYGTAAACTANATNPETFKNLPDGSKPDMSAGKGWVCRCDTPLSQQGEACTPW